MFPLGLGYIASSLINDGHEIKILDIDAYNYCREEVLKHLSSLDFDAAGITGIITTYGYVKWLASEIKKIKQVPIVAGGVGPTSAPRLYLQNTDIDIFVDGEGELTAAELFTTLEHGNSLNSVKGIQYKKNKNIYKNDERELIENLNSLPFPAWDLFPIDIYLENPIHARAQKYFDQPYKSMGVSTVRGCPYRCAFCYHCFQGKKTRFRSPSSVIDEIRVLKEKYGVSYIALVDDNFMINRKRVLEFCKLLRDEGIDIKWGTSSRVDLVHRDVLKAMKSSGCIYISFGFESGSQKILDNMSKGFTVEQSKRAIDLMREIGIEIDGSFMIGMIGETRETVKETISFLKEMNITGAIFYTTPLPGTVLYKQARGMGLIPNEEEYVLKLGEFEEKPVINLTNFSMEELMKLKKEIRRELIKYYITKPRLLLSKIKERYL